MPMMWTPTMQIYIQRSTVKTPGENILEVIGQPAVYKIMGYIV